MDVWSVQIVLLLQKWVKIRQSYYETETATDHCVQ